MSRSAVLVDADWVQAHLDDPGVVLAEVDEDTTAAHLPQEQAQRSSHIPGPRNVPWSKRPPRMARLRSDEELRQLYAGQAGLDFGQDTIAYFRIGERSTHTWVRAARAARPAERQELRRVVD